MTTPEIQAIMIFSAVIVGVISAGYLYQSGEPVLTALRKAMRMIAFGMLLITFGVLVAASIIFSPELVIHCRHIRMPCRCFLYLLFIAGSILILLGGRQFTARPARKWWMSLCNENRFHASVIA